MLLVYHNPNTNHGTSDCLLDSNGYNYIRMTKWFPLFPLKILMLITDWLNVVCLTNCYLSEVVFFSKSRCDYTGMVIITWTPSSEIILALLIVKLVDRMEALTTVIFQLQSKLKKKSCQYFIFT